MLTEKEMKDAAIQWAKGNPNCFGINGFQAGVKWALEKITSDNSNYTKCVLCGNKKPMICGKCHNDIVCSLH